MDNQELLDEINRWNSIFTSDSHLNNTIYELAFFKIFIKFEKFLSVCFENYAIGVPSSFEYCPRRKLIFQDIDHLIGVIKKENSSYIHHFDVIKNISKHVFEDNPFEIINSDSNHTQDISKMKALRDYIAHESDAAKNKYIKITLDNRDFVEPCDYLRSTKRNTSISYFTYYINKIKDISDFIINRPSDSSL